MLSLLLCLRAAAAPADAAADLLTEQERAWLKQQGALRYAVDSTFAPVEFARADGTVAGIAPDTVGQLARQLDLTVIAVRCPTPAAARRAVETGQADFAVVTGLVTNTARGLEVTRAYFKVPRHWIPGATAASPSGPSEPTDPVGVHFGVARGNSTLLAILNKGLAGLGKAQRQAILRRWTAPEALGGTIGGMSPAGAVLLFLTLGVLAFTLIRLLLRRALDRQGRAHAETLAQRQAAEESLRRSLDHAQSIFRHTPLSGHIYRLHPDGRLMLAETNPAADRSLGLSPSLALGQPMSEIFPHWPGTDLADALLRIGREGGELQCEQAWDPGDAAARVFDVHAFQTLPGRVAVFWSDQTERHRIEQAVRQRVSTLTSILNSVPQWVAWKDTEGAYLGCNQAFALGMGLDSPSAVVGRNDLDLPGTPREAEAQRQSDREVIESQQTRVHPRETLSRSDGTRWVAEVTKVPLFGAASEVLGVLSVAQDVTQLVRAEEQLQESLRRLQASLDALPFRLAWKDRHLGYVGANRAFALAAGLQNPEDLAGRNDFDLKWRTRAEELRAEDRQVLETGLPLPPRVETGPASDGRGEGYFQTVKIPLKDDSDQIVGILEIGEDITERRRLEQVAEARRQEGEQRLEQRAAELEVARQQLQALSRALAQDLHAPLRAVEGYATMLAQDHGDSLNSEGLRLMEVLQRETRRMGQVIQALLDHYPVNSHGGTPPR